MTFSILHTISSYDVFGPEKTTINECLALIEKGYKTAIVVIWPKGSSPFLEKLKKTKIPYYHLESNARFDLGAIKKLQKLLSETKAAVVHSHGYKSDIISLIACRLSKIPVVTTVHGWTSEDRKVRIYEKMQAFSWRLFDFVICVSDSYRNKAIKRGVPAKKVIVINNGIMPKDIPEKRKEDGCFNVGIIGRLSIEKGHKFFLEAASIVLKNAPNVNFFIVGEGPERSSINKMIKELGIGKNVRLLGHIDDMKTVYKDLDAVAIASLREGLPNVLLESMLYEKPVVATAVGGIPEVINNGTDGLLVPPKDSQGLAGAVLDLIGNPEKRKTLVSAAKDKVLKQYSFEQRTEKVIELYENCINSK